MLFFAGLAFVLMGVGLAADADAHASAAAQWLPDARPLRAAYRLGGAAFIVLGLALPFIPIDPSRLGRGAGVAFLLIALWQAWAKRPEWAQRPLPRGLQAPPSSERLRERVARWCGWGVAACFAANGLLLLKR